jgi:hypothetical protein
MADKQDSTKEYRVARWFTLSLFSFGILTTLVAIGAIITTGVLWFINKSTPYAVLAVLLDTFMLPLLCLAIFSMGIAIGQHRFGYLRVSPDGLEHRWWPLYHLSCEWDEVTRLRISGALSTQGSYLLVRGGRRMGSKWAWQLRSFFGKLQGFGDSVAIPLHVFQDWPKGQDRLARDLQQYIPHLFTQDTAEESRRKRRKRPFRSRITPGGQDAIFVETAMGPVSRSQLIAKLSAQRILLPILALAFVCMLFVLSVANVLLVGPRNYSDDLVTIHLAFGILILAILLTSAVWIDSQIRLLKLLDAMGSARQSDQGSDEDRDENDQ